MLSQRIENLGALKALVRSWFAVQDREMADSRNHAVSFFLEGTPKSVRASLANVIEPSQWEDLDGALWGYNNVDQNFGLTFARAGRKHVYMTASVLSLHLAYIDELRNLHVADADEDLDPSSPS